MTDNRLRFTLMPESLTLSRYKLTTFLACQRQFQLRYLNRLPWPVMPLSEQSETAVSRGQAFHQLVQQQFLNLPIAPAAISDVQLRRWWTLFRNNQPPFPAGQRLTEISLTVPVGNHLLNGRFDLVILGGTANGQPAAHVFDWKTGTPQSESQLRHDWQTRLYLGMLAEGGLALWPGEHTPLALAPENVSITYWYVQEPGKPRIIRYNTDEHNRNWAELHTLVDQIEQQIATDTWPLTDDWSHCRRCAYQTYCGRQGEGVETAVVDEDSDLMHSESQMEPNLP